MDPQGQTTSLQNVEKDNLSINRIVRVLELAGGVMEETANPRKELVNSHCSEFMQLVKDIQMTLRGEIKSACEYSTFEKWDYVPRISNKICWLQ